MTLEEGWRGEWERPSYEGTIFFSAEIVSPFWRYSMKDGGWGRGKKREIILPD